MPDLVQNWIVRKPLARSRGGIVASQSRRAALIGAEVLAAGGNAVDAAVSAGFALSALEPWNSGIGGVGFMLVHQARERRTMVVDFGAVAPRRLDPEAFPLSGGVSSSLFPWPEVAERRNEHGPLSIAVPGEVDGLALALERFGTIDFARALAPAIAVAEQGLPVDWYATLRTAIWARDLALHPSTMAVWLPDGLPPTPALDGSLARLKLDPLADTLRRLARAGARDFYEGEIARKIADDMRALGGVLDEDDLAAYRARIVEPLAAPYRGGSIELAGGLTAGPTMAEVLARLDTLTLARGAPDGEWFGAYAEALRAAYARRLDRLGEGVSDAAPTSTTHMTVVDRDGNMVSLTKTLLSVFGSKLVLPRTGILMNNGILWFDPRPGKPNSMAPGKRPLSNMCPAIARRGDGAAWFAIGASGGRSILPAVLQVSSFLIDHGLSLEDAIHHPRIDVSGGADVVLDPRLAEATRAALAARFPTRLVELMVQPGAYAAPNAVLIDPATAERQGIADVMSPWSGAAAEGGA